MGKLTLGLDYGTSSCRGLVVDAESGEELATATSSYKTGTEGVLLDPGNPLLARQHPQDYIDSFLDVARQLGTEIDLNQVVGIGVDTTGSSPMPVDALNQPLADSMPGRLAAECWLWKDHTAYQEAAEITRLAIERGEPYLAKCGGTYSSEWWWSKLLHCLRSDPDVFHAAANWVEICDWIPATLCGITDARKIRRSRCAAGHKAMFEESWGGLPSADFLKALDPHLASVRERLYDSVYTSDQVAGTLSAKFAQATGLPEGIPVAVGGFDAHFGAVGSGARPGTLVKIIGTSTCDCIVHPLADPLPDIPGLCGIVQGSILPGFYGLEAGQSAVGDIFDWVSRLTGRPHEELNAAASKLQPGSTGLLGLDWHNGNRTVLVDPLLSGLFLGFSLHSTPAELYRAAIEATAFGAKKIIERISQYGVPIDRVVACGGIAEKSPLVMQIYADVLDRPMQVASSSQTCALGAAVFASVVAGVCSDVLAAQDRMVKQPSKTYQPGPAAAQTYTELYQLYTSVHDQFGTGSQESLRTVMKRLIAIREAANEQA